MGVLTLCISTLLVICLCNAFPQQTHYLDRSSEEIDSEEYGQFKGPRNTNCTCGTTNKSIGRIVGGKEAKMNEYPYMAALARVYKGKYFDVFCGSAIISEYHALTAAHCTVEDEEEEIDENVKLAILAGAHDITKVQETNSAIFYIEKTIEHEDYDPETYENDIALIVLSKRVSFSERIGRVCLPTQPVNQFLVDKYVKVTGWGDTSFNGSQSKTLLKINLRIVPLKQCSMRYRLNPIRLDDPIQFCTYGHGRDSCQGDSGGPVTWLDPETNRYTLVGVVSFGKGCGSTSPGVNSDVYRFLPWITKQMNHHNGGEYNTCVKL